MCCVGQKVALAEHPPWAVPERHMYGSAMEHRFFASQVVDEHCPVQEKRVGHEASEQHLVQNLVLFHASGLAAHPPLLAPDSQ